MKTILRPLVLATAVCLAGFSAVAAAEPKPIPAHRPELKLALERLKSRTSRLPLPAAGEAPAPGGDRRAVVHNGLARRTYLPAEWFAADFKPDPDMTLDYAFKTRLFWIVSRGNNCHYCLGHQEHKLSAAGMLEDEIAALDSHWETFPQAEQAAFALARQLTLAPHQMGPDALAPLEAAFDARQIVELVYTISFYNSVNRWTDALGLPQDAAFGEHPIHFDQPTSEPFRAATSCVIVEPPADRGPWPSAAEVEAALDRARTRVAVVPLADQAQTRAALGEAWPADRPVTAFMRALAVFPTTDRQQSLSLWAVGTTGRLSPERKALLGWVAAQENRAWYALAETRRWLDELGVTPPTDRSLARAQPLSAADQAALRFAIKLTDQPQTITDDDLTALGQHFDPHEVAEIVYVVAAANFFDRFTETLQLPLDE